MFTDRRINSLITKRIRQPWPAGKPFKILSLDGGGIKGVYAASILQQCEQHFCNGRLASHFDMVAGTSTGGLIALGLGLNFNTDKIMDFYRKDGRKIFPKLPSSKFAKFIKIAKNSNEAKLNYLELKKAVKNIFGDNTLGQSRVRLVIPAFMMPKTEIVVFKTDHHSDFKNDYKTFMWEVARATTAAPTYLKGLEHQESGRIFLDGGVWANNPIMVAVVDALSCYEISLDQLRILSIGTGNAPFELPAKRVLGGWWNWREIIKAAMYLTTDNATAQAKLILGPEHCLRIEPENEAAQIELDDYDTAFSVLPELAQKHFEVYKDQLSSFFKEEVKPRERYYSN